MSDWIVVIGVLAAGSSTGLLVWLVARPLVALPVEDRRWMDPPPRAWQPLWPVARALAPVLAGTVSASWIESTRARLRRAGLEYAVSPEQYLGVRAAHAVLGSGLGAVLAGAWGAPSLAIWALAVMGSAILAGVLPALALEDRVAARRRDLVRNLPFCLDLITLCVEAGLNLQGAMAQAVAKGPRGALRDEMQRCLREVRAGRSRAEALRGLAERCNEPGVSQFVQAVIQAEATGMNLGPVLRAQADQRRNERFLRAEKLAMQAPVKLLLPLIACIFPCTFAVLFFPIAMKFLQPGL